MIAIRTAQHDDIPALTRLIEISVRELQRDWYTPRQIELALAHVYGIDSALIDDATYYIVEADGALAAGGGWSGRTKLYGGDVLGGPSRDRLDPARDPAKIRAFFVHPDFARRGLGRLLLAQCERAACAAGFRRAEMGATLSGVAFYEAHGYRAVETASVPLPDGEALPVVRMERTLRV